MAEPSFPRMVTVGREAIVKVEVEPVMMLELETMQRNCSSFALRSHLGRRAASKWVMEWEVARLAEIHCRIFCTQFGGRKERP